jgi:Uma2 family endonuclease
MSYEEFLDWCDEDTLAEWVDGQVMISSPASDRHQDLADFLTAVLRIYVESRGLGRVRSAPFQMKTGPDLPGREPDVLYVSAEHLDRLKENYLDGPADLVVEIVSPKSGARDRGDKFYEYEEGGVSEYWLIDPQRRQAEFYQRGDDNRYHPVLADKDDRYHARLLPGFWLRVSWLWQTPLPSPIRAVGEISGVDPALIAAFEQAIRGA